MPIPTIVPTITLRHGALMPVIGLGTWPMDNAETQRAVVTAIEMGYRLIDTAENYENERGVGQGIRDSGIPREELFITSKFNRKWHGRDKVRHAFDAAIDRLGVDYLDLMLIHWPNPDQDLYVEAFHGLMDLLLDRRLKAIGLSNFKPSHTQRLIDELGGEPDVDQIQLSPYHSRPDVREFNDKNGIVTQSWSPLGRGGDLLEDPVITKIANKYGKTPAQVILRWHTTHGLVAIPKSSDPQRQRENLESVTFDLDAEDMAAIDALDQGDADVTDADSFWH